MLFFLGILLLVGMLKEIGVLSSLGQIYNHVPAVFANYLVGLLSATIDNVPLTAALLKTGLVISESEWLALTYAVGVGRFSGDWFRCRDCRHEQIQRADIHDLYAVFRFSLLLIPPGVGVLGVSYLFGRVA